MSEMDEISRDTGRTFREILNIARGWIHQHRTTHRTEGVRKLTRKERRDLAETVRAQVGEERIAAAWFTKRVNDYQREAATSQERLTPASGVDEWTRSSERLNGIRYSIESTLHSTVLSLEHRGQVVQALDAIEADPGTRVEKVFPQLDAKSALEARTTAVHSEQWVARENDRNDRILAEQRAAAERRANPIPHLTAENTELRRRISELENQHSNPQYPARASLETDNPFAALVGPAEVFHLDEHEYASVAHRDRERRASFATREEAYAWTSNQLDPYPETSTPRGEDFTAIIHDRNHADRNQVVDGPIGMVTDEIQQLRTDHQNHREQGRETTTRPDGQAEQTAAQPPADTRLAEVERQLRDMGEDRDRLSSRVEMLQRGLDAVTADRNGIKQKLSTAEGQIEALKNRNQRLAAEIGDVRDRSTSAEQITAERDRYKQELAKARQQISASAPAPAVSEIDKAYGEMTRDELQQVLQAKLARQSKSLGALDEQMQRMGVPDELRERVLGGFEVSIPDGLKIPAREALSDTQSHPRPTRDPVDGAERNGHGRNGTERSR